MTGFARKQLQNEFGTFIVEIKSVNSRYLDISYKAPDNYRNLEIEARNLIGKQLTRGKVECFIRWSAPTANQYQLNHETINVFVEEANKISNKYGLSPITTGELLRMQNVFVDETNPESNTAQTLLKLIEQTLVALISQRQQEGQYLANIILERINNIKNIINEISTTYKNNIEHIKIKLNDKISVLSIDVQSERFEQELIYLLQKTDIEEEIDRLNGHLIATEHLFDSKQPVGRKLDFLLQEMNREVNTIGSKANSFAISMNTVDLKVLLEQIREQVQNIE